MKRLYKLPWKGLMSLDVTTAPTAAFRISAPRRRRADVVPRLAAGCGLGLVALAAGLAAGRAPLLAVTGAAVDAIQRFLSFFGVFFLVVQAVDGSHRRAQGVITIAVAAAAVSAAIGLYSFFTSAWRAGGPISDPNDFGVLLATAVPLA